MKTEIDKLISISREKLDELSTFLQLTKEQSKKIEADLLDDEFGKILDDKSKIMERIDALDEKFIAGCDLIKKSESIDSMEELSLAKYDNLPDFKEVISKINEELKNISKLDKENMVLMNKNMEDIKLELRSVKDTKTAYKGYGHENTGSMMIDERK